MKETERFLNEVGRELKCGRRRKKELLAGLREELTERGFTNNTSYDRLVAAMGPPTAVAGQIEEDMGERDTREYWYKRGFAVVVAAVAVALAVWLGAVAWAARDAHNSNHGTVKTTITESDGPLPFKHWDQKGWTVAP